MEHSDNKKPPTDDRSSSPDPNSLPRSRKTDEYNHSPYNDHGHSPYLDVIETVPGVNSKPFLPPETLDIVDGIRPSSSKTRGVSHLPAIEESLYEDKEEVGLGESRSASSISSSRLPSLPSSLLSLNSKHSQLNRVSCKPALTSISEEFIPRISDPTHGGQASQNDDVAEAPCRKRSRSQSDESKYRILQGFGDVAAVRSRDVTHVRVPESLIHPTLHRNESLFAKPGLKVRAWGEGIEGYEDTIGNVDTKTSECTEELRMKLLQLDTSHLWGYFGENSEQVTQDRCNSHPTLSDTTCDGASNQEQDGASNTAVDHPEPTTSETVPQSDASYGADGEGNLSQQYYTLCEGSYNEAEGSQQVSRAASRPGEWQGAYLNSGDLGNESMFCRIGEEQVIPIGDIMTTYTTVTTQTCVFKPVCIASLNIYINQIVLGSLCEVIVQLAIKRAFQEIKKKKSTQTKNGLTEEADGTKTNHTPNSTRPKNSGSDSVIADTALSSGDVSMPRESFSEHTTGSASSERQDKEFKDKESKKQRDKEMVSKQRGRERERNKRKRDREDRGISPGKQKSLRNAVGDMQRMEDEPGAGEKITGVIDFGFRENVKVAPRQSGQPITGKEVSETTSTGIGQTNVRIIDVTRFVEASESSNRNEDSGDVRDHAMKTTCGLESQTVTSQSDDSSMGDNQTFRGRLRTTESSDTQSEDDKIGEEAPWNVEAIKMSTSRFGKRTSHHRQKQLGGLNTQVNLSTSPVLSENTSLTRASRSESEKDVSDFNDVSRHDIESATNSSALQEFETMGPINTADDVTDSTSHDSCLESGLPNRRKESLNSTSFASIPVCAVFNESFNHPPKYSAENVPGDWDHRSESQTAPPLESNTAASGGSLLDLQVSVENSENTALIDVNETFTTVAESAHDDAAKLLSGDGGKGARDGKHLEMHSPSDVVSDWPLDWDVSADTSEYVTAYNQDMPQNDTTGAVNLFQDCSDVMIKDGTVNDEDPFCDNKLEHLAIEHVQTLSSLLYNHPIVAGGAESGGVLDADDIHSCTEREEEIGSILESEHTQCADGSNYLVAESSQHEIDGASLLIEAKHNANGVEENTEDLSSISVCGQHEGKENMPEVKEQFVQDSADTLRKQEVCSNEFKISEEKENLHTVGESDDIPGDGIDETLRDTRCDITRDTKGDIPRENRGDIPGDNTGDIPRHNSGDIHTDNIGEIPRLPRGDNLGQNCIDIPADVSVDIPCDDIGDIPGYNSSDIPVNTRVGILGENIDDISQDTRWDCVCDIQCNNIADIPGDTRGDFSGDESVLIPGDFIDDIARDNIGDIDSKDGRRGLESLQLIPEHSSQIQVEERVTLSSEEAENTNLTYDRIDHSVFKEEVFKDILDHTAVQEEVLNDKIDHDAVQEEVPNDKIDHATVQEEVPNYKIDHAAVQKDLSHDRIDFSGVQDHVSFDRIDQTSIFNSCNETSKEVTIIESCLDNKLQQQSSKHEAIADEGEAIETEKLTMHKSDRKVLRELSIHVGDDKVIHGLHIQEGDEMEVFEVPIQDCDKKATFEVPIQECDEKVTFDVTIQEGDEKVTFDVTIQEGDEKVTFEVPIQECDEKVAFEVPTQKFNEKMAFEVPTQEAVEKVTFEVSMEEGDEKVAFEASMEEGDEKVTFEVSMEEGDEKVTFEVSMEEGDEKVPFEISIPEDNAQVLHDLQKQEYDDYVTDQVPIHEGDEYVSDQAPLHECSENGTDQAQIHEGDEDVTHKITIHQGDNYKADQTQILKGDEKVTFEGSIPEGNVKVTQDLPKQGGDDCVMHQVPIQDVNDMVDTMPCDGTIDLNLSENDSISDADHQVEKANVHEMTHSNTAPIAERYLDSSQLIPNNGTTSVESDFERVDHLEPTTAPGTAVDPLSLDVQSTETNLGFKRENSKTTYTSVLTTTDSEIVDYHNDSVLLEELENTGDDDVLLVKNFPVDDSVPSYVGYFDGAIMSDHTTESNAILGKCKTISVTVIDEHATSESLVLDEQEVITFTVLGAGAKEQEATESTALGEQEATEATVLDKQEAFKSTVSTGSDKQEAFKSTVSDKQEAIQSNVSDKQETIESTVSGEQEAIESTVREDNLEQKYVSLKDEDRYLHSSPKNEQKTLNAEARHIKLGHQEDQTKEETAMALQDRTKNLVEREEKDGDIFLQQSADTDHDNYLYEADIMKTQNEDVIDTLIIETVNIHFEDGNGAEIAYDLKKHREGDEDVFIPSDPGLGYSDVATADKPFQRELDPSWNEDGVQETQNIERISDVAVDVLTMNVEDNHGFDVSNVMKKQKDGDDYLYTFSDNEVVRDGGSQSFVVVSHSGHEQMGVSDTEHEEAAEVMDTGARVLQTEEQQGIENLRGLNKVTKENEIMFRFPEHCDKLNEDHLLPDYSSHINHHKIPSGGAEDGQKNIESELVTLHSSELSGHTLKYNLKKEKVGDEVIYTLPDSGNWEFEYGADNGEKNSDLHTEEDEPLEDLRSNETVTEREIKKFYYLKMFPHYPDLVEIDQDGGTETDGAEARDLNIAAEYHQIQYHFTTGKDTKKYTSTLTTTDGDEVNEFKRVVQNNETENDSKNENYEIKYTSTLTTSDQYADGHHRYGVEEEECSNDKGDDAVLVERFASGGSYIRDVDFIHADIDNLDNSDLIEHQNISACQEKSHASVADAKGNAMDNTGIMETQNEEFIKCVDTETMQIHFTDRHGAKQSYELKKHREGDEYVFTPADNGLEYADVDNTGQLTQFDLELSSDVQGEQGRRNIETISDVDNEVVRIHNEDTQGFDVSYDQKKHKDGDDGVFKFSDNDVRDSERQSYVVVSQSGHEQTCLAEADSDNTVDVMDTGVNRRRTEDREGHGTAWGSNKVTERDEVVFTLQDNENEDLDLNTGGQKSQSNRKNVLERRDTVEAPRVDDIEVVAVERVSIHFDTRHGVRVTHELNKQTLGEEYIFTFSNQGSDSRLEDMECYSQVETDIKSIRQDPEVSNDEKVNNAASEEMVNFEKISILSQDDDEFMYSKPEKTGENVDDEGEGIPSGSHENQTADEIPEELHDSVEGLIEHDEREWSIPLQESVNIDRDNCLDETGFMEAHNEDVINSETLDIQMDNRRGVEITYDFKKHIEGDEHAFTPEDDGLRCSDGDITGQSFQCNLEPSLYENCEYETRLVERAGTVRSKQESVAREESPANDAGNVLIIMNVSEKEHAEILDTRHAAVTDATLIDKENVPAIEIAPNSDKDTDVFAYNLLDNEPWGFEVRHVDQEVMPDNFAFSSSPMSSLPRELRRDSDKEDNERFVISLSDADCKQASNDVFEVYLSDGINSEIIEGNFVGLDANEWKFNAGEDSVGSTDSVESMVYGNDADIEETYSHNETESSLINQHTREACEINDCSGVISEIESVPNVPIVPMDERLDDTHKVTVEMQSSIICYTDHWTAVPDDLAEIQGDFPVSAPVQQLEIQSEDTSAKISRLEKQDIQISSPVGHRRTQDIQISSPVGHIETPGDIQISSPVGHIETPGDIQISSPVGHIETPGDIQISSPVGHIETPGDIQISSPVGHIETPGDIQISSPVGHIETQDIQISTPNSHIETQGDIQISSPFGHRETQDIQISSPVCHIETQGDIQISSPKAQKETHGDIVILAPVGHKEKQPEENNISVVNCLKEALEEFPMSAQITNENTEIQVEATYVINDVTYNVRCPSDSCLNENTTDTDDTNSEANAFSVDYTRDAESERLGASNVFKLSSSLSGPNMQQRFFNADETQRLVQNAANRIPDKEALTRDSFASSFNQDLVLTNNIDFAESKNTETDVGENEHTSECDVLAENFDIFSYQDPLSGEGQGEPGLQSSSVNEVDSYRPALRKKSDHFVQEEEKQCTVDDGDIVEQTQKNNGLILKERTVSAEFTVTGEDMDSSRESQELATHRDSIHEDGKEKISPSIETLISESLLNSRDEESTDGSGSIRNDELCHREKTSGNVVTCGGLNVTKEEDLSKQREEDNQLAREHLKSHIETERHYAWKVMSPITYKEINIGCIGNLLSDTEDHQNIVSTDSHDSSQDLSHSLLQVKTELTEASILSAQEEIHIPRTACKWDDSSIQKDGIEHSEVEASVLTMRQPVSDMDRLGEAISHFTVSPQCRQITSDMGDGRNVEKEDEMGAHTEQVYMEELEMSNRLNMYRDTVREVKSELSPARYISDKDEDTIPLVKESKDGRRRVKKGAMAKQSQNLIDICSDSTVPTKVSDRSQLQKTRSADEFALPKGEDRVEEEEGPGECYNLRTTKSTPVPQSSIRRIKLIDVKEFPKDMPCIYRPYEMNDSKPPAPSASETNLSRPNKPITFRHRPSEARRPKKTSLWKRLKSILKAPRLVHRDGKFRFVKKYKKPPSSEMSARSAYMSSTASDSLLEQCQDVSKSKQRGSKVKIDERFNFRPVTAENGSEWQMESPAKPVHRKKPSKRNEWRQFRRLRVLRHSAETMGPVLPPMRTQNVSNKNYVRMLSENYQRAQESKYRHGCEEEARTKRSKKRRSKSRSSKRVRSPLLEHPKDDVAAKRCAMVNSATPEVFEVFCHEDEDASAVKEEPTVRMLLPVIKPSASNTSDPDSTHMADNPGTKCHPCAHLHEMSHIHQDMYKKQSTFWRWRCVVM